MAWSWSHSQEAYDAARENLYGKFSKKELAVILREWAYYDREQAGKVPSFRLNFNPRKVSKEDLSEAVWSRAEEFATCDNGGFNAYVCPDGCHTVPFSRSYDEKTDKYLIGG